MFKNELKAMIEAGKLAREAVLKVYQTNFDVEIKKDNSPVTEADKKSDYIIRTYLHEHFPSYSLLSEETSDDLTRLTNDFVFIIDPLDGTADFCAKNDEFAINIALSYKHEIAAGVVVLPVKGDIYYALKGEGAYLLTENGGLRKIHVNNNDSNLTLYTSRFHPSKYEELLPSLDKRIKKVVKLGSAIKACYIAEGKGEVHYRLNEGTKEWDIAPIDLIVREAGGIFVKKDFTNYQYNKVDVYNHGGYIIANKKENILTSILQID